MRLEAAHPQVQVMPQQISQLKFSRPRDESTIAAAHAPTNTGSPPARIHGPCGVLEAAILEQTYAIPSLQVTPGPQVRSQYPTNQTQTGSKQGRSISHPFPSLFKGKEKPRGSSDINNVTPSGGHDGGVADGGQLKNMGGKFARLPNKDLVTGRCITCDSTVRWPRELLVFRCTVCSTINDLQPAISTSQLDDFNGSHPTKRLNPLKSSIPSKQVPPLSIAKTRALIDRCIEAYLLDHMIPGKNVAKNEMRSFSRPSQEPESIKASSSLQQISPAAIRERIAMNMAQVHEMERQSSYYDKSTTRLHGDGSRNSFGPFSKSTVPRGDSQVGGMSAQIQMSDIEDSLVYPFSSLRPRQNDNIDNAAAVRKPKEDTKDIFKPLQEYIITSFASRECVNASFTAPPEGLELRPSGRDARRTKAFTTGEVHQYARERSGIDPEILLTKGSTENGSWWIGGRETGKVPGRSRPYREKPVTESSSIGLDTVSLKSPRINWTELSDWYKMVINVGWGWERHLHEHPALDERDSKRRTLSTKGIEEVERQIIDSQARTQRVLLKATESLLKRPGAALKEPDDIRFILVILANPLLYPSPNGGSFSTDQFESTAYETQDINGAFNLSRHVQYTGSTQGHNYGPGHHSGIIKRVLGILSNLPNECHHHLVSWFAGFPDENFRRTTDLVGSFITHRLMRQQTKNQDLKLESVAGVVPNMAFSSQEAPIGVHTRQTMSIEHAGRSQKRHHLVTYDDDWQIKAAAKVMSLLFSANDLITNTSAGMKARAQNTRPCKMLATSSFYNLLLDYSDLISDFEAWEAKRSKFSFCQYPFFLSIWAKIQIMEHDARRQMEVKAREAFFDSIMTRKSVNQYLVLKIRRECLVEDSLKGVSEVVGSGGEEIKKGLRIEFQGEEGVDAGGLRKEWFLLLVRDVFNPGHGMFVYDEDSHFCYFNPHSFETSDQFFLVGVVLGLAIYNSTILDVALPAFAFRKLLAASPTALLGAPSHAKPTMSYRLEDLAEVRPALASGLRQLLEYDGDVQETFCRDFVAEVEQYGEAVLVPLCPNGEKIPVTNANRREFVDLYVRYLLDRAVTKQFEPFKRGFFTVCGGNALSLFQPDEIELLIRGSDEPLDITSLQAVATYDNWGVPNPAEAEPIIRWFWHTFKQANPKDQRKLLGFITGSDRIPAMGATSLVIKISCLGSESSRFPIARTCFNMLSLWRYGSRQKLETMLWRAVKESEGFGLK